MKTVKEHATDIVLLLRREGYSAFFAGGWVRDFLMDHPSSDIDIATDAPPQKILDLFPRTLLVGISFGVVIVLLDGHQFEVSTFRKDIEYLNGRKPDKISFSLTPEEDASRRDFTINGMFYDPIEEKVYDFVKGMEDLHKKIIRTIGNPYERFSEDRLRMIRAIRFSSRFSFVIDQETQEAIVENADSLFPAVAVERVWNELQKMAQYPHFDTAIIQMHRLKLLQVIFPQLKSIHLKEIIQRVRYFPFFPPHTPPIVYVMELFSDQSLAEKREICTYMRMSAKEMKWVQFLDEAASLFKKEMEGENSDPEWVEFYAQEEMSLSLVLQASKYESVKKADFLKTHEERQKKLQRHIDRKTNRQPLVTSLHLKKEGINPGKKMGMLLKEAEKITIIHNLEKTEDVIDRLKNMPEWPSLE